MIYKNKTDLIEKNITKDDIVLDVGFWGQGVSIKDPHWPHALLLKRAKKVIGVDLEFDASQLPKEGEYKIGSAEDLDIDAMATVIFAGDLIEHLSNPGKFLDASKKRLLPGGRLILTTPNCFNLFNLAEKLTKKEPTTNIDHTCYFNSKTLTQLLDKNGWKVQEASFLYWLGVRYRESYKKKFLNLLYKLFSLATPKFVETLVIIAVPK